MSSKKNELVLIENTQENRNLVLSKNTCDKLDYIAAVGCGAVGGLIDIFFVGSPEDSKLLKWTDSMVDNAVMKFAKLVGWNPKEAKKNSVSSAIGFLERKFKVNYDQRYTKDVGGAFNMNTKDHHMKSLGHSPDIIGLFFSVLNQFTGTASFVSNGQLITITSDYELQGGNFIAKLFCGVANWFGHIMSDIAGSSGGRGNAGRGSGVVIPFYELFQFCKFGSFNVGKDKQDLATIATRAFESGYDARFGLAMAIPVVITDLSIKLIWALRLHFEYKQPLKNCIPSENKYSDLRMMLIVGHGTLCVMDGTDAAIRSGGNFLAFFMRLNLIAWFRFTMLVLKEVCIRLGLTGDLSEIIDAFKKINEALLVYLHELEKIDIEAFKLETQKYNNAVSALKDIDSDEELNKKLLETFDELGIKKPWQGDFDEFMSNKNSRLVFE